MVNKAKGTSVAEQVRDWVDSVPPNSVLDVRKAPCGASNATRAALARLARDPAWPVEHARRNIYWRSKEPS